MDQRSAEFDEVALDPIAKGMAAASFLAAFASAFLLLSVILLLVTAAIGPATMGPIWPTMMAIALGFLMTALPWTLSMVLFRRVPLAVGTVLFGFVFAFGAIDLTNLLASGDAVEIGMNVAGAVLALGFALRVTLDGFRLVTARRNVRNAVAAIAPGRANVAGVAASLLNIHPICAWLPSSGRRVAAATLFAATTLALSLGAGIAIVFVLGGLRDQAADVAACFKPGQVEALHCAERLGTVVFIPLIVAALLAISAALRWLARTTARNSLESIASVDHRPAILFLRSFGDDQVKLKRPRRGPFRWLMSLGEPRPRFDHLLFEEGTPIGPVVAIGLPGRPAPFGAARTFVDESHWKDAVAKLANGARAVVVVMDNTDGVLWELGHIRAAGHEQKTLFILPPHLAHGEAAQRLLQREMSLPSDALPHTKGGGKRACIGWYRTATGRLKILTAATSTSASYTAALRQALRSQSDLAMSEVSLDAPPVRRRPILAALVDALAVVAIVTPLIALTVIDLMRGAAAAHERTTRARIATIGSALEAYRLLEGKYPDTLASLLRATPGSTATSPLLANDEMLRDGWGRVFVYRLSSEGTITLESFGRDGEPGGAGEDADIVWPPH